METYNTGNGSQQISLTVDITTIGLAASRAIVGEPGSGNPPVSVGHSMDATGDISLTDIGAASTLAGKTLNVMTSIDLSIVGDENERKAEVKRIQSTVILDNGIDGYKKFTDSGTKTVAQDFSKVIINSQFKLIP